MAGSKTPQSGADKTQFIRDTLEAADNDPNKETLQLNIISNILKVMAKKLEEHVDNSYTALFNAAAEAPANKNNMINRKLLLKEYNPLLTIELGLNPKFAVYTSNQISQTEGYAALHAAAQKIDVAVNVLHLTSEERGGKPGWTIDVSKTYEQGAGESNYGYPDLTDYDPTPKAAPAPAKPMLMLMPGPPHRVATKGVRHLSV